MKRRPGPRNHDNKKDDAADAEYFARAMADVRHLPPDPRGHARPSPPVTPRLRSGQAPVPTSVPVRGHDDDENSAAGFVAPGVDRRELRKLKRGDYAPGKRLDLHGMTAAEAIASVARFIDSGRRLHRCVCIVHGRGLHSGGNVAILKTRGRALLKQDRAVLAYADAPRNDGGPGAVYVLLRK